MSYIYFARLKATHVQVLHILWFILDLFLELSCNAFKAIFSYRPLSSSLVFFLTRPSLSSALIKIAARTQHHSLSV